MFQLLKQFNRGPKGVYGDIGATGQFGIRGNKGVRGDIIYVGFFF